MPSEDMKRYLSARKDKQDINRMQKTISNTTNDKKPIVSEFENRCAIYFEVSELTRDRWNTLFNKRKLLNNDLKKYELTEEALTYFLDRKDDK